MTRNGFLVFSVVIAAFFFLIDVCLRWERKVFVRFPSLQVTFEGAWRKKLEELREEMEKDMLINEVLKGVEGVLYFPEFSTLLFSDEESFKRALEVVRKEVGSEPKPSERGNEKFFRVNNVVFVLKVRR